MKQSKTILLIDDDIDDQEFFLAALEGIQNVATVQVAGNGREALDLLENKSPLPDFIFSDINMPMMDGIECLAEIVKRPHTKNIPVVILSSDAGRREVVFSLGARSFIEKNSDFKKLQAEVEQVINGDTEEDILQSHFIQSKYTAQQPS